MNPTTIWVLIALITTGCILLSSILIEQQRRIRRIERALRIREELNEEED